MSKVSKETMLKLEELSMLKLSDNEREIISSDLEKIIQMFDKLNELDTEGVEPLIHVNPEPQVLGPDTVKEHLDTKTALANSANTKGDFFVVPKIIKQ